MRTCPSCGFPINRRNLPAICPKCDEDLIRAKARKPLVVDLAHRSETVSLALTKLEKAVSECLWHYHGNPQHSACLTVIDMSIFCAYSLGGRPRRTNC